MKGTWNKAFESLSVKLEKLAVQYANWMPSMKR